MFENYLGNRSLRSRRDQLKDADAQAFAANACTNNMMCEEENVKSIEKQFFDLISDRQFDDDSS